MSESEDRRRILSMLANGKISPDEADRLIEALEPGGSAEPAPEVASPQSERPFFLHITIDDPSKDKAKQVDIRMPLDMVRGGMIASASIPSFAKPVRVPFVGPKDENIERMLRALEDLKVDIDDESGKQVRVFCE